MKLRDPRLWLTSLSLIAVLLVVWRDLSRTSPGALSAVHAGVAELRGRKACSQCHGQGGQAASAACLRCHEEIETERGNGRGLHGALPREDLDRCQDCHREHLGSGYPLIGDDAFQKAGHPSPQAYQHENLDFRLSGAHLEKECADCHEAADLPAQEGRRRFLGLSQECVSCHDDPHQGRMRRACEDCHGQQRPWAEVAVFQHDSRFPLTGAHAQRKCLDCHPKEDLHSVENLDRRSGGVSVRACADCHDSPHGKAFLQGSAALLALDPKQACASCHPPEKDGEFATAARRLRPEEHAASGFRLEAPHDRARCEDCHADAVAPTSFAERFPGRDPDACGACHADPHGGQFDSGPFAGKGCLACHDRHAFLPSAFGVAEHERSPFPLTGRHRDTACEKCHGIPEGRPEAARRFRGTPQECESCHPDPHGGAFDAVLAQAEIPRPGGRCAVCHDTEDFAHVPASAFDHGKWTGFVLQGAHARADCRSCHSTRPHPDARGRSFGKVEEKFPGDPRLCESCHQDIHRGLFDQPGRPPLVNGRRGCERCHDQEDFRSAAPAFDHERWTGHALTGAHARAQCTACHPRLPRPDAQGRGYARAQRKFPGDPRRCDNCHEDVHRGAFDGPGRPVEVDGRRGCERCHDQESFASISLANFDHQAWTDFALIGAHRQSRCESCHGRKVETLSGGLGLGKVRERFHGPFDDCRGCHPDPHRGTFDRLGRPATVDGRRGCERCHDSISFRRPRNGPFDHTRWTDFPLRGAHAEAACRACHAPLSAPDRLGRESAAAPGTRCQDCHADPHVGQFARAGRTDCARCHGSDRFEEVHFDHQEDSRFPLDRSHRKLACSACHRRWPLPGGGSAVRFKPLGTRCEDCHGPGPGSR